MNRFPPPIGDSSHATDADRAQANSAEAQENCSHRIVVNGRCKFCFRTMDQKIFVPWKNNVANKK